MERAGRITLPPAGVGLPERHVSAPPAGAPIPKHWRECACCGVDQPLGMDLTFVAGADLSVSGVFEVTRAHQGGPGLAHGGLMMAALDEALGCLCWLVGSPGVTAHVEVDFKRPVPVGSTLYLGAEITGVIGRKIYGRAWGRIDAPDGVVAIAATGLFVKVPLTHFITYGRGVDVAAAIAERQIEVNP